MGRQNKRKPILLENIKIIDTANKGKSVAKHDGIAIFVQGGVPGDICDIKVFKRRKSSGKQVLRKFTLIQKEEQSLNANTLELVGVANGKI